MGAGEPGMLSLGPPMHGVNGPLARAAGLRGPARAHWVCPVPLFPSIAVSHPCRSSRHHFGARGSRVSAV